VIQINQEIKPTHPDGWHFPEADTVLKANSYKELIVKVTEYRISQRKTWDTVQQEVNTYLVGVSPTTRGPDIGPFQKKELDLSDKVYNWLSRTYDKMNPAVAYASAPEALRRASTCIQCPYNTPMTSGCGACVSQMQRMARGISKGRSVNGEKPLKVCSLLNYDLKVAIHLEDDTLGPREEIPHAPNYCWRKP
jgi:hypothetical protein